MTSSIRPSRTAPSIILFVICWIVLIGATVTASRVQEDFGRVAVSNVTFQNWNGIPVRAKLFRPMEASAATTPSWKVITSQVDPQISEVRM